MSVSSFVYRVSMWESIISKAKDWYTQFTTGHSAPDISSSFANTDVYTSEMNHICSYDEYAKYWPQTAESYNAECLQHVSTENKAEVAQFLQIQTAYENQPDNLKKQYNAYLSYMNDNIYGSGQLSIIDANQSFTEERDNYMKSMYGEEEYSRIKGLIMDAKNEMYAGKSSVSQESQREANSMDMTSSRELPFIDYGTKGQPVKEVQGTFGRLLPSLDYGNAENELSLSK